VDGPWRHRTVRANGIALHVAELGSGPLVLLLHGFPQFWWTWHRQLRDLADAGYRAVAVDLRGFGASDKPPRGYDTPNLANDIGSLVSALGENDAVVVGSDLGGMLAWTMAATRPELVRGVVVLGAAHPLRLRTAIGSERAQRRASRYALRTFQVPRRPEHLLARDSDWVRSLFETWSGPAWRAGSSYDADVERYAQAMRIHPAYYCAAEYFRWLVRSLPRKDGRR
jgi:pimeloyl-ACP methyl ester carboxylesterase